MRDRFLNSAAPGVLTVAAVNAVVVVLGMQASAQNPTASVTTLKTPWGEPDLQGIWTSTTESESHMRGYLRITYGGDSHWSIGVWDGSPRSEGH